MSRRRGAPPPAEALFVVSLGNLEYRSGHRRDCAQVGVHVTVWAESPEQARARCVDLNMYMSPHGTSGLTDDAPEYVHAVHVLTSTDAAAISVAPCHALLPEGDR